MAELLEVPHLAQQHGVAEVEVRRRRIEADLDRQRLAGLRERSSLAAQLVSVDEVDGAALRGARAARRPAESHSSRGEEHTAVSSRRVAAAVGGRRPQSRPSATRRASPASVEAAPAVGAAPTVSTKPPLVSARAGSSSASYGQADRGRGQHTGAAGQGLGLDAALEGADLEPVAPPGSERNRRWRRHRRAPGGAAAADPSRPPAPWPADRDQRTTKWGTPMSMNQPSICLPSNARLSARRRYRGRQRQCDLVAGAAPRRHRSWRRSRRPARRPSQLERQTGGAAGAVDAQLGRPAVGVEVLHVDTGRGAPQDEEPVGAQRQAAPHQARTPLGGRCASRLRQGDEIVAAAGEAEELGHGTSTSTVSPASLSLPLRSTALT